MESKDVSLKTYHAHTCFCCIQTPMPLQLHTHVISYFWGGGKGLQISFHFLPELRFLWDICLNVTWSKGWSWTKIFEMPILHTLQMIYYISSSFDHTKLLSLLHIFTKQKKPSIPHLKYVCQQGRKLLILFDKGSMLQISK